MATRGKIRPEIWGLVALFGLFLATSFYFEQIAQETSALQEPSSLAAQPEGVKALYLLYQQIDPPYRVDRLRQPWNHISPDAGLAFIIEPQSRPPTEEEIPALKRWIEAGGTALFIVSKRNAAERNAEGESGQDEESAQEKDTITGDVDITEVHPVTRLVAPVAAQSPYVRNVSYLSVSSPVRLKVPAKSEYQTLFQDEDGIVAIHKPLGRGHVLVVANDKLASNSGITDADNVDFLNSIAWTAVGSTHREIVFDEYHHGVGFEHQAGDRSGSLIASMPIPMRLGLWHLLGLGALLLYNGNRRFGQPRAVPRSNYRLRADFVNSMGLLLRKAEASDIALLTLYQSFARDLRRSFDLAPEATAPEIVAQAARRKYVHVDDLRQTLIRCEEIVAGTRIREPEMLSLTRKLDQFRRDFDLVGHQ
ncbi:MAG TPA: DUF4350 domain-containing protein [Chthonomonadaceae bacterium]|nr:DUF4350 domain-containing protein [Chthonomonadaceae bacterium]